MTEKTQPTDTEIEAVLCNHWPAFSMQATLVRMWLRDAMRASLDKWGQPAHSGEPVYAFRRKGLDDFCTCTEKRYAELSAKPNLFETRIFYTAPQPVEREPLTQAQVVEAFCALPHQVQFVTAFDQGVRFAEKHHGIK